MINKKIIYSTACILLLSGTVAASSATISTLYINHPKQKEEKVVYSTTKGNENLIQIVSDGLDPRLFLDKARSSDSFKDFYSINNYVTTNTRTLALRFILDGWEKSNPYKDIQEGRLWEDFDERMAQAIVYKMQSFNEYFGTNNIISPINFMGIDDAHSENSGNVPYLNSLDENINVFDWIETKDFVASEWGVSTQSPDIAGYEFAGKNYEIREKGSHNVISELISHGPYTTSTDGTLFIRPDFPNDEEVDKLIQLKLKSFESYIEDLKSIIGPNGSSVYDNSLIIIHGDHGFHSSTNSTGTKNQSLMFIKYPHTTKDSMTEIADRLVFAPHTNRIIEDWFKNYQGKETTTNPISFIMTNSNFNIDRLVPVYTDEMWVEQLNQITGVMDTVKERASFNSLDKIEEYSEDGKWNS